MDRHSSGHGRGGYFILHDDLEDDVQDDQNHENDEEEPTPPHSFAERSHWPQSLKPSLDAYSQFSPMPDWNFTSPYGSMRQRAPYMVTADGLPRETPTLRKEEKPRPERPPLPHSGSQKAAEEVEEQYYEAPPETKGSSFLQAMCNGVNVLAGVGVLSTPYAMSQGGWLSLVVLLLLALICCYTGVLLRACLDSQPGLFTYPDIGEAAFGDVGRIFIAVILYTELYACCVEFLILEGDNLSVLFPNIDLVLGPFHLTSRHLFVIVSAICILPTVWLRDLSVLSYVSAGGVIASLVVVVCVFWVGLIDRIPYHPSGPLLSFTGMPVAVGLYGFCYSGHAVFPNLYTSLRNRSQFNQILYISFGLCTVIYGSVAVLGFAMFGQKTETQITLNLPGSLISSKVAVWTTVVNPFTKFALTITPVALSLEELLPMAPTSPAHRWASIAIRTLLVASTVAVALLVPFFGFVMAFIGSLLSMTVSVILPCACFLRIQGKRTTTPQRIACIAIMGIGALCAVAGTYTSVSGIISKLIEPSASPGPTPGFGVATTAAL